MKFAEVHGRIATAAKLLEEEMGEKGPSRALETQLIKVEGRGGGRVICILDRHCRNLKRQS